MNTNNSKTGELHKFRLNLTDELNLGRTTKHISLSSLSIYYTWRNIKKQYRNNKITKYFATIPFIFSSNVSSELHSSSSYNKLFFYKTFFHNNVKSTP